MQQVKILVCYFLKKDERSGVALVACGDGMLLFNGVVRMTMAFFKDKFIGYLDLLLFSTFKEW